MEDEFVRLIINTSYRRAEKEDEIKRLASGVEHWELNRLIQKILKPETADEVMDNFMRDPPRISILYVKRTEINKGIGYIE